MKCPDLSHKLQEGEKRKSSLLSRFDWDKDKLPQLDSIEGPIKVDRSKVAKVIKKMKNEKAVGPSGVLFCSIWSLLKPSSVIFANNELQ